MGTTSCHNCNTKTKSTHKWEAINAPLDSIKNHSNSEIIDLRVMEASIMSRKEICNRIIVDSEDIASENMFFRIENTSPKTQYLMLSKPIYYYPSDLHLHYKNGWHISFIDYFFSNRVFYSIKPKESHSLIYRDSQKIFNFHNDSMLLGFNYTDDTLNRLEKTIWIFFIQKKRRAFQDTTNSAAECLKN